MSDITSTELTLCAHIDALLEEARQAAQTLWWCHRWDEHELRQALIGIEHAQTALEMARRTRQA